MIKQKRHYLKHISRRRVLFFALGGLLLLVLFVLFAPLKYTLSYEGDNCHAAPVLAPGALQTGGGAIKIDTPGGIVGKRICLKVDKLPGEGTRIASYGLWGLPLMGRIIIIEVPKKPRVSAKVIDTAVPATRPLKFDLTSGDTLHEYVLKVGAKQVACSSSGPSISCNIQMLDLDPDTEYPVQLDRRFKDASEVVIKDRKLKTLSAATVLGSSIQNDTKVYDKPRQITVDLDKPLTSAEASLIQKTAVGDKTVPLTITIEGKRVILSWAEDLPRSTAFELTVKHVEAQDGSDIIDPYVVKFEVSGGPKVTGVSIGRTGVVSGAVAVITYDQDIAADQLSKFITLGGGTATIRPGAAPNQAQVALQNFGLCADFTISVAKGMPSKYGIVSEEAWSYNSRTICHSVETIGYSRKGRAINAYFFGNGPTTVMYVGAIHGSEASSSLILQDWIDYLDGHAKEIPGDRRVVVVPSLSPDGLVAGSRYNANRVNLNRNFATSDWKKDIKDTNGPVGGGGGAEPMSEPETKAIAALSSRLRPRLVMSYHAVGSVAIANQVGISSSMANTYASMVGYSNGTGNSAEIFTYEISGTYDDWLAEKLGTGSIVVELGDYTYRNFGHHRAAMWAMATR